jgi:hypothetical protein
VSVDHYSTEFERDDEGWWPGRCVCGWDGGMYPDAEDAADALMDHAADAARKDAKTKGVSAGTDEHE